jgi:Skp family chaperone for outer membrane proteins
MIMRSLSAFVLFTCAYLLTNTSYAQEGKIGYVDQQYIFESMPEFKKLNQDVAEKSSQYDKILKSKYDEYQLKASAYEKLSGANPSPAILRDKATELENLKKSFEEFQENSMTERKDYYGKTFSPIKKKVNDAIIFAGRQKGYAFILRMDLNPDGGDIWPVVLYAGDSTANLSSEILKNLGINGAAASSRKIGLPQTLKQK